MRCIAAASLILLPGVSPGRAQAQAFPPPRSAPTVTVDRGLAFLARDALVWKSEHGCASCHHAALVVWAMREAQARGHEVEKDVLTQMTEWIAASGDGKTGVPRPASAPRALNSKAIYFALALEAEPRKDAVPTPGLQPLLATVKEDQIEDGSWSSWPDTRPPIFGRSDEAATALAALALDGAAPAGDDPARAARDRAIDWLSRTPTDGELQPLALRLLLGRRAGRPPAELEPLTRRIRDAQGTDGGWSQTREMASDAWATGQALYALGEAGVGPDDAAIERGRRFLVSTQRDDGSWAMTSRPIPPSGEGAKSLIPITCAGSAWAVLGLVRSG